MDKTLELIFLNEEGRIVRIMIRDPKENLSTEGIQQSMETIIDKDVFTSSGGSLVEASGARLVTRTIEKFLFSEE